MARVGARYEDFSILKQSQNDKDKCVFVCVLEYVHLCTCNVVFKYCYITHIWTHTQVKSQLSKAFEPALTSVKVILQQFDKNVPKPIQSNLDVHY